MGISTRGDAYIHAGKPFLEAMQERAKPTLGNPV